jgi:hypothetical protein
MRERRAAEKARRDAQKAREKKAQQEKEAAAKAAEKARSRALSDLTRRALTREQLLIISAHQEEKNRRRQEARERARELDAFAPGAMDEEARLALCKAREQEMRERRADAGIVDDATAVARGTQFVLGDNGCHLRCAACRERIEEGKDYREFRCTAGCRVVLHPGLCTKSLTVSETGEKLSSNAWKLGMRCLTDMAQPGDCDGTGILARLTGGAKMVYFEGKMKERDRKPQPPPKQKNPPSISRKQKAAERAAAAEAAANGGAGGGDGAAPSEESAASAPAAPAAAAPAGPAVPALSAEAAAAAAALAAQEGLTRKERRVPLQRPVVPEHPGARAPAVSSLPPEQLLARSDPVKIIHRRAEERAEEEAEAEAARRAREERQAEEDAKAKKPKKQVLPVDIHYRDANAEDGQPPPQRRSEADVYEDPIQRPAAAAPASSASSASSMASRLSGPATPSREAFPPLESASSASSDASSAMSSAQRAGAPTSLQAASGAGAAMLRSLLADAGAAATPFLLVEGLDFSDFPRGEAGALKWLRDAGGSWHIAGFEAFPTLRAAALRCDSPPDATGLRLLLRQRRLGGREMRVDHLTRWPDAAAVRAADASERDAAAAAQRTAAAAAAEAEKVAKATAAAARRAEKAAAERAAAERAAVERAAAERAAAERAAAERAKAAAAAAAPKPSSTINPRAAPFVPPSAAAPEPPPWANAQVVATQGDTLAQYRTMPGNVFGLDSDSLAPASAPHGGVFCAAGGPVTALLLLNLDDQTLHGLFRARPANDGGATYAINGGTACAFEALAVGRAIPLAEAATLAPSVAAAGGRSPFALSADETARLERAMFAGRRMHHGAMLTAEEQAARAAAAATSAHGDDDAAELVAQMESDEAFAMRLQAEEQAAAAAASAGRRNGNGGAAAAPAMPRPGAPRRATPAAAPPTPPPAPPPVNGWDASFRAADASPYAAAQPWEAQQQHQQQQAPAPAPQAAPPAPAKRADPMDAMTSALFAKMAAPAPFEPPAPNLPPLPGSAMGGAGGGAAEEAGGEDAALQSLFPWMFPQAATKAQPPPYRPPT